MKKEIELKDIAGYLAYNVKIQRKYKGNITETQYSDIETLKLDDVLYYFGDKCSEFNSIKLVLHPISDLTKEIEVNGERIVPIVELAKLFYKNVLSYIKVKTYSDFCDVMGMLTVKCYEEDDKYSCGSYFIHTDSYINKNEYRVIQKLLSWHFDINGLIEKGLAIDINTLKQN